MSRFAGLVPLIRFAMGELALVDELRAVVGPTSRRRHPVHLVLLAFVWAALGGFHKLAHVEGLSGDAVLRKFSRLSAWPVRKVFSAALRGLSDVAVGRLVALVGRLGLRTLEATGSDSGVLDFDSVALLCFGQQEGARFGYCGRGRNRRRHFPLVASVAETRAVVHASYRDGRGIAATEFIDFVRETLGRVAGTLSTVLIRADSGFWSRELAAWLLERGVGFAMALPLYKSFKPVLASASFEPVNPDEFDPVDADELEPGDQPDISIGVLEGGVLGIDPRLRVVVVRRLVHDTSAPPPGKVIASAHSCRFQALVTSLDWDPVDIWRFYNGRGDCERVFKTGRQALGLGWLVGHAFRTNQAAFLLRMLAFNLDLLFQQACEARSRKTRRRLVRQGLVARQHEFYNSPGRLQRAHGRWQLRTSTATRVRQLWNHYGPDLLARA